MIESTGMRRGGAYNLESWSISSIFESNIKGEGRVIDDEKTE